MQYRKMMWNAQTSLYEVETANGEILSANEVVYVNFEGGSGLNYRNNEYSVDNISMTSSGFTDTEKAEIVKRLNAANPNVLYVWDATLLAENSNYSTVFVGETDAFDSYGNVRGISETTGETAVDNRSDNAFVMTQNITTQDELVAVIAHEVGHLTGTITHDVGNDGTTLDDFMALYPSHQDIAASSTVSYAGATFAGATVRGAGKYGGALYIGKNSVITIRLSTFSANSAFESACGGAIGMGTGTKLYITDCNFEGNQGYSGGAIDIARKSIVSIHGSTFTNNKLTSSAAAANATAINNNGTMTIGDCVFDGNGAGSNQYAIVNYAGQLPYHTPGFIVVDGLITLKTATDTIHNKGKMYVDATNFTLVNHKALVIDAYDENWLSSTSNQITVGNETQTQSGYWVYRSTDNIDLYLTDELTTAVVANSVTYNLDINGVHYNGPYFSSISAAFIDGASTVAASGITVSGHRNLENYQNLVMDSVLCSGSTRSEFGGVFFTLGKVQIFGSTFTGNHVSYDGGALYNSFNGSTIDASTFSENIADSNGGALVNTEAIQITNSQFTQNSAASDGGVLVNSGTATILGSTFSNNNSDGWGGAIYNASTAALIKISDSLFENNVASNGGAIFNSWESDQLIISNATFSGNSAANDGGAIYNANTARITNSKFLTATDTIYNTGDLTFAGTNTINANVTNDDGTVTATNASFDFANSTEITIQADFSGATALKFSGKTVNFTVSQNFSNAAISISTTLGTTEGWSFTVASGVLTLTGATFTVNGQAVTLGTAFDINGTKYLLNNQNSALILQRNPLDTIYVNSTWTAGNCGGHVWGYDAFGDLDEAKSHMESSTTLKIVGGNYTGNIFANGETWQIEAGSFENFFGGKNNGNVTGDIDLDFANASFNAIYGGSYKGNVSGNIHVTLSDSVTGFLFGASAGGSHNNTTLDVTGSTVATELGGGAMNANHNGSSQINVNGGRLGTSDNTAFLGVGGLRAAGNGSSAMSYTQSGKATWLISGSTISHQSFLVAAGYAYNMGGRDAAGQIAVSVANSEMTLNSTTGTNIATKINGSVWLYGGGRAYGNATSTVTGNASMNLTSLSLALGSRLTVFGGGLAQMGGVTTVSGTARINISGNSWNNDGTFNVYGGASGAGSVGKSEIVVSGNVKLSNLYGGGFGNDSKVLNGSYIKLTGNNIDITGTLSGGGASSGATVSGTKILEFSSVQSTFSTTAVTNFNKVTIDEGSTVVFSKQLNLSSIGEFNFIVTESGSANHTALTFASGVSSWNASVSFSVSLDMEPTQVGSYNLLTIGSGNLSCLTGANVVLTLGPGGQIDLTLGNYTQYDNYELGLVLDSEEKTLKFDVRAITSSYGLQSSQLSNMVNTLQWNQQTLSNTASGLNAAEWNKKNNGILA